MRPGLAFVGPMKIFFSLLLITFSLMGVGHAQNANGIVFYVKNANGTRDDGETGIADIGVSNGREVVATDAEGKWTLPHDDDTIFFVIKPSGWAVPVNEDQLPQFYHIHKPAGSPEGARYAGVEPHW